MKVVDLVEQVPLARWDTDALEAIRLLTEHRLSGLVVAGADGVPDVVIPGPQLLRLVLPQYVLDDPQLAHVYDEAAAGELMGKLRDHRLGDLRQRRDLHVRQVPSVLPEDTVMEVASVMCEDGIPLVLVRDRAGRYFGVVTLARLTAALLELGRAGSEGSSRTLRVDLADHAGSAMSGETARAVERDSPDDRPG